VRIALIKTSSMGDVIHALPVVTDIATARPDARVDWVVEESFADLPRLHPAVGDVITVAVRRWRRALASADTWAEIRAVRARLREARYDLALDLQGLVKSAWIARWTGAPIAGFDRASVREPLAALAYAKRCPVASDLHAIDRLRSLAAQALGYTLQGGPRFGLAPPPLELPWRPCAPYAVLLHATSRAEKSWPEDNWIALGRRLLAAGVSVVLPWGGDAERAAAQRLARAIGEAEASGSEASGSEASGSEASGSEASGSEAGGSEAGGSEAGGSPAAHGAAASASGVPCATVAPRMSLRECVRLLADARAVVGVDTGLTHLAAALERPTVALFAATAAWRYGPYWTARATSLGADGVWPDVAEVLDALAGLEALDVQATPGGSGAGGRRDPLGRPGASSR